MLKQLLPANAKLFLKLFGFSSSELLTSGFAGQQTLIMALLKTFFVTSCTTLIEPFGVTFLTPFFADSFEHLSS